MLKSLTDFGWEDGTSPYLSLKLNVPASSVAQVVDQSLAPTPEGPIPGLVADLGFGNMRLFWWRETAEDDMVLDAVARIRAIARSVGGSAVVEHCPLSIKAGIDVWGDPPQGFDVMRSIKQRFDPQNILSPGRFVGGL
jgi:glycolate oxidase FAD binding subunit